jgi:hypothetical protein
VRSSARSTIASSSTNRTFFMSGLSSVEDFLRQGQPQQKGRAMPPRL